MQSSHRSLSFWCLTWLFLDLVSVHAHEKMSEWIRNHLKCRLIWSSASIWRGSHVYTHLTWECASGIWQGFKKRESQRKYCNKCEVVISNLLDISVLKGTFCHGSFKSEPWNVLKAVLPLQQRLFKSLVRVSWIFPALLLAYLIQRASPPLNSWDQRAAGFSSNVSDLFLFQCCGPTVFDDQQRVGGHWGHQQHGHAGRRTQFLQLLPPAQFPQRNTEFLAQDLEGAPHQVVNAERAVLAPSRFCSLLNLHAFSTLQRFGEGAGPSSLANHLATCSVADAHRQQSGGLLPVRAADLTASRPADLVSFILSLQTRCNL